MGGNNAPTSNFLAAKLFGSCNSKEFELSTGMDLENLETATEVIDALGGNNPVAELTSSKPNAVSNWRSFDAFPPNTYVAMTDALHAIGKTAPASLWKMKFPAETERVA